MSLRGALLLFPGTARQGKCATKQSLSYMGRLLTALARGASVDGRTPSRNDTKIIQGEWNMQMQMLDLSDEQKQMRQLARDFVDKEVIPFISKDREREWTAPASERMPWELLKKADKLGLRGLGVPEKYGGIKLEDQAQTFAIIAEELARGDSGFADIMGQVWKVPVLLGNIMPAHFQDEWFPKFMEDPTFLIAHCLTEPRGASDRWLPYNVPEAAMNTKAELKDGHWTLNGRKQFITNGYDAKLYIVYANTNPKVGMMQGTSSFLIPRDTPGLIPVRTNEKMGARYMNNGDLVFDNRPR